MDSPERILKEIENRRVLVIGDTIVDCNTYCQRTHDLDDGTPVYRALADERGVYDRHSCGGAALVVRNLLELGAKVDFLTGIGYGRGHRHAANLHHPRLSLHALQMPKVQTVKHRYWDSGKKLIQIDEVDNNELPNFAEEWLHERFDWIMQMDKPEVIVIADYRHGLISDFLAAHFVAHNDRTQPPVIVSSQVSQAPPNHDSYAGATSFVLNQIEAQALYRQMAQSDADYVEELRQTLNASCVIVTCGAEGCLSADELVGGSRTLPPIEIVPIDTCGAGDAFLAAYAVTGILSFANLWAALSCTVPGANPPTKEMLKPYAGGIERDVLGKNRNGAGSSGGDEADHHAGGHPFLS